MGVSGPGLRSAAGPGPGATGDPGETGRPEPRETKQDRICKTGERYGTKSTY